MIKEFWKVHFDRKQLSCKLQKLNKKLDRQTLLALVKIYNIKYVKWPENLPYQKMDV